MYAWHAHPQLARTAQVTLVPCSLPLASPPDPCYLNYPICAQRTRSPMRHYPGRCLPQIAKLSLGTHALHRLLTLAPSKHRLLTLAPPQLPYGPSHLCQPLAVYSIPPPSGSWWWTMSCPIAAWLPACCNDCRPPRCAWRTEMRCGSHSGPLSPPARAHHDAPTTSLPGPLWHLAAVPRQPCVASWAALLWGPQILAALLSAGYVLAEGHCNNQGGEDPFSAGSTAGSTASPTSHDHTCPVLPFTPSGARGGAVLAHSNLCGPPGATAPLKLCIARIAALCDCHCGSVGCCARGRPLPLTLLLAGTSRAGVGGSEPGP